jgi:hypothetical protein
MERQCKNCHSTEPFGHWKRLGNNEFYCHKCAHKFIYNPKRKGKRFSFKGVVLYSKKVVRKGICSWCNKVIDGINVRRTSLHHLEYHEDDPLKDTVEICNACHSTLKKSHPEIERICFDCGSKHTGMDRKPSGNLSAHWYFVDSSKTKFLCNKCYCKRKKSIIVNN